MYTFYFNVVYFNMLKKNNLEPGDGAYGIFRYKTCVSLTLLILFHVLGILGIVKGALISSNIIQKTTHKVNATAPPLIFMAVTFIISYIYFSPERIEKNMKTFVYSETNKTYVVIMWLIPCVLILLGLCFMGANG